MYSNVGRIESVIRVLFGTLLIVYAVNGVFSFFVFITLILFGIAFILTGIVRFCALYSLFGISTKGRGINRISKKDIEIAVKEAEIFEDIKRENEKTKKVISKKINKSKVKKKKSNQEGKKKKVKKK